MKETAHKTICIWSLLACEFIFFHQTLLLSYFLVYFFLCIHREAKIKRTIFAVGLVESVKEAKKDRRNVERNNIEKIEVKPVWLSRKTWLEIFNFLKDFSLVRWRFLIVSKQFIKTQLRFSEHHCSWFSLLIFQNNPILTHSKMSFQLYVTIRFARWRRSIKITLKCVQKNKAGHVK